MDRGRGGLRDGCPGGAHGDLYKSNVEYMIPEETSRQRMVQGPRQMGRQLNLAAMPSVSLPVPGRARHRLSLIQVGTVLYSTAAQYEAEEEEVGQGVAPLLHRVHEVQGSTVVVSENRNERNKKRGAGAGGIEAERVCLARPAWTEL